MKFAEQIAKRHQVKQGYHSAFVTSFSVEFNGFEELMLPQLAAAGSTNIMLIADERMSAIALADGTALPQQLGRNYVLHGPEQSSGVFHPKILLQLGRDGGRAFVGSANATAAGIGGNLELVTELQCTATPSPEQSLIASIWDYVREVSTESAGAAADALNWAAQKTPWLQSAPRATSVELPDGSLLGFFANPGPGGIAERFVTQIQSPVERLIILSPYWDDLSALRFLQTAMGSPASTILIDRDTHEFPLDQELAPATKLVDITDFHPRRFKHAKLIIAQTAEFDHVLTGSANCTTAAMGAGGFAGHNAEASVYRRVPRNIAIESLGLDDVLGKEPISANELTAATPNAPIPLAAAREKMPGRFEAERGELLWVPSRAGWTGRLILLDLNGEQTGEVAISEMVPEGARLRIRVADLNRVHFVQVDDGHSGSSPAPLIHRDILQKQRREVASEAVRRATEKFDSYDEIDLLLLQAFDELDRADGVERELRQRRPANNVQTTPATQAPPRELSYEEFVKQKPEARNPLGGESSTQGTNIDPVRALLNRLSGGDWGQSEIDPDDLPQPPGGSDGADESDDPPRGTPDDGNGKKRTERDTPGHEQRPPIDRAAFLRARQAYIKSLSRGDGSGLFGNNDVLRLRFWLLLILHAAWRPGFRGGLPCGGDEEDWPRHIIRVLSAFFFGASAPIKRLSVSAEDRDMPVDFLEAWATSLWALGFVEKTLQSKKSLSEFAKPIPKLRAAIISGISLTQAELDSATMRGVKEKLDEGIGAQLSSAFPAPLPRDGSWRVAARNAGTETPLQVGQR